MDEPHIYNRGPNYYLSKKSLLVNGDFLLGFWLAAGCAASQSEAKL